MPTQYEVDRLAPGLTSGQATFAVDSSAGVTVQVTATNTDLVVSIEGPGGQLVDETTVLALGGDYGVIDGDQSEAGLSLLPATLPGVHYIFEFPSFGPGTYVVHFNAPAGLTEEVAVATQLITDSRVGAALTSGESRVVVDRPMALIAAVFDGSTPIVGANASVTILPARDGSPSEHTLADDGNDLDVSVGDGLYSGRFTPAVDGLYHAVATISGLNASGEGFVREASTSFAVFPLNATLTGIVQDRGIDTDEDLLFDTLAIDVDVDAVTAGQYKLSIHLTRAGGEPLIRTIWANLQVGQQTMTVVFSSDDIRELEGNGPYEISLVRLLFDSPTGLIPADRLADVGSTQAYDLDTDFEPPALALAGPTSDIGVDDDTDGTFDRLVITIPVEVQVPGGHLWRLTLTTDDLQVIDSLYGNTWLVAGTTSFQVEFDGARIRNFGADGPYRLRSFHLSRLEANLYADEIGVTQSYTAAQFDAPNPQLLTVEPGTASAGESVFVAITGADTTFTSGVSSVDAGADISTSSMLVQSKNRLSTRLTIDPAATLGPWTITVTTNGEAVSLVDAFSVDTAPELLSIVPDTAAPGASVEVTVTGENTNFAPGISTVDAGQGIAASNVTVADETSLTATLGVDMATAAAGPRTITVTTLDESVLLEDGFTVESGALLRGVFTGSEAETLAHLDLVVNSVSGGDQCWVRYDRAAGTFTLIGNDTDTTTVVGSVTAGSTNSVMNNRCTLYGNHSTASLVAGQLALEYHLVFAPLMLGENDVWVHAQDAQGVNHVGYKRVDIQDVQ